MECLITAHKGIGLAIPLAGNKELSVPAGVTLKVDLTGDQIGYVEDYLASQARHERLGDQLGGKVSCKEREVAPPAKSKKGIALAAAKKGA